MLIIKEADSREINELFTIYIEKVKRLREMHMPLWDESQFTLDELKKKYGNPVYYVSILNDTVIGGFILLEYDLLFWPDKINDNAYYFHKFVIDTMYCGKGFSDSILSWVKKHGKEKNKKYIRLDYDGNRKPITELYTRNGFVPVEIISNEHVIKLVKAEYVIV